jgi:hypothetical protein
MIFLSALQGLLLESDLFCFSARLASCIGRPQQSHPFIAQSSLSTVLQGLLLESDLFCWPARVNSIKARPQQGHLFTVK